MTGVVTLGTVRYTLVKNGGKVQVLTGGAKGDPGSSGGAADIAASTHAATSKATPVDADELPLVDSAASFGLAKLTWANIKAAMWTAWGALVNTGTSKATPVDADALAMMDSAATNATKKLTWANLKATLKTYFDAIYLQTIAPLVVASANLVEQRNGANGQLFQIYDNYVDASNKSYLKLGWGGTTHQVVVGNLGTASVQSLQVGTLGSASVILVTAGTNRWQITNQGHLQATSDNVNDIGFNGTLRPRTGYFGTSVVTPSLASPIGALSLGGGGTDQWRLQAGLWYPVVDNAYDFGTTGNRMRTGYFGTSVIAPTFQTSDTTVASLPAAAAGNRGQRRHVTDSTVAASGNFGATVAGGGANVVPVFSTGSAWIIA